MESKSWPNSSQISSTYYFPESSQLRVNFHNGSEYTYSGVPKEVWEKLKLAPSVGKFVNSEIKTKFEYRKTN